MNHFCEPLERRSLFSSSTLLPPSAVEGKYKGTLVVDGQDEEVLLTLTSSAAKVTVVGIGTRSVDLTAHDLEEIRKGTFSDSTIYDGTPVSGEVHFSNGGDDISGSATYGSGSGAISGTIQLHKYGIV